MKRFLSIISFVLLLMTDVISQDISEHTRRREEIEREIAFIDKQLAANRTRQQTSTKELAFIQRKISNRKRLITQIEQEVRYINAQSASREREIARLTAELETLKKNYNHLIYNAYKYRDKSVWILYVLASKNIEQGYRRWGYLKSYSQAIKNNASEINEKSAKLTEEILKLAQNRTSSIRMKAQREEETRTLERDEKRERDLMTQLSRREREFRQQLTEKRREMERLNREIERILAEAARQRRDPGYRESEADRLLSDNFESNKGRLPWPVKEGVIIEHFGQHNHPVFRNIQLPFNNGINISTTLNAEVLSVFDGVVKQILVMPGYNQCVLIQHGNFYTFYTKLDKVNVKSGDVVKTGQTIGTLTENEGNSIIHFQLWNGTTKQNPEHWISSRRGR